MTQTSNAVHSPVIAQLALHQLDAEYWHRADARSERSAADLFLPDGELFIASLRVAGHESIYQFFANRAAQHTQTQRITRHFSGSLHVQFESEDRANMRSMVVMYAWIGDLPGQAGSPTTIADVEDICQRDADGNWLFLRRTITPTFLGTGTAAFTRS